MTALQPHLFDDASEAATLVVKRTERPALIPLSQRSNPMIAVAGPDPAGRTCGDCRFLFVKHDHGVRRYYRCEKRGAWNHGPATDHLVRWAACALFDDLS